MIYELMLLKLLSHGFGTIRLFFKKMVTKLTEIKRIEQESLLNETRVHSG